MVTTKVSLTKYNGNTRGRDIDNTPLHYNQIAKSFKGLAYPSTRR